ncbi:MAG: alpha/beta hydrolase-fold protein [Kosmotogaceae bacterium]
MMKKFIVSAVLLVVFSMVMFGGIEFNVILSAEVSDKPLDGRLIVIISDSERPEPRFQVDVMGVPIWGITVDNWEPGSAVIMKDRDNEIYGYPLEQFSDIPAGDYNVQAFFTVYKTFERADGHVIKISEPGGNGGIQRNFFDPGNIYSDVQKIYIDPDSNETIELSLNNFIEPDYANNEIVQQGVYEDSELVKYVTIKSELVSEFWGQPMYIGANILLPKGYNENPDIHYPVYYLQGHWPGGRAPLNFGQGRDIDETWMSDDFPRMIVVEIRDANPYYGTSYSINSENLGPYGDAIVEELIPYLEDNFRMIPESWARLLSGGSTGGWEALALQIWYPDIFGGTWPVCPDGVDFRAFQLVNIYEFKNAYFNDFGWIKTERPSCRTTDGNILFTVKQENHWEHALATHSRSGRQWAIWEAVYSPVGEDGYPAKIWDPVTGVINKDVAESWKKYDIRLYLEENWDEIGDKLVGKIHLHMGDMDNYYLNVAAYKLEEFLEGTTDPYYDGSFTFYPRTGHGVLITHEERILMMAEHLEKYAPAWVNTSW